MRSYLIIISSHSGFILRPQMSHFSVPKWIHFRSSNETISGPQMSPFRDSQDDPKMTPLCNKSIMAIAWGIARENAGLLPSASTAQSPSHSLSHPSDGFATTPARTAAVRASVNYLPGKKCNGSSARLGFRARARVRVGCRVRVCVRVRA